MEEEKSNNAAVIKNSLVRNYATNDALEVVSISFMKPEKPILINKEQELIKLKATVRLSSNECKFLKHCIYSNLIFCSLSGGQFFIFNKKLKLLKVIGLAVINIHHLCKSKFSIKVDELPGFRVQILDLKKQSIKNAQSKSQKGFVMKNICQYRSQYTLVFMQGGIRLMNSSNQEILRVKMPLSIMLDKSVRLVNTKHWIYSIMTLQKLYRVQIHNEEVDFEHQYKASIIEEIILGGQNIQDIQRVDNQGSCLYINFIAADNITSRQYINLKVKDTSTIQSNPINSIYAFQALTLNQAFIENPLVILYGMNEILLYDFAIKQSQVLFEVEQIDRLQLYDKIAMAKNKVRKCADIYFSSFFNSGNGNFKVKLLKYQLTKSFFKEYRLIN